MWWFAALHANLALLCDRMGGQDAGRKLLDAGCGTGGLLARLSAALPDRAAIGLDADRFACERARAKSGRPVCAGSVDALPFADGAFGAIVSADVLCHSGVDERAGAGAVPSRSVRKRRSDPEPAGLFLADVGARQSGRQCQAL